MAVFIPAPNCAKVEVRMTQQGQMVENVFHAQGTAPFDGTSLATLAAAFKTWWVTYLAPTLPTAVSLNSIKAVALDTISSVGIEYVSDLPAVGTGTGNQLPMNVTFAIKWLTGLRGRSYNGRTFHVGMVRENVNGSKLTTGSPAAFQIVYGHLISAVGGAGYGLVVVSYRHNKANRTTAVASLIQSCSIEETLDSQRRRLPGRGK